MADTMSLDGILNDEKPAEPVAPVETPAEAPAAEAPQEAPVERPVSLRKQARAKEYEAQGRDPETGQFVPKEEAAPEKPKEESPAPVEKPSPVAPQQQPLTPRELAFQQAMMEERRKRQALEAEHKAAQPPKQFWDDPEAAIKNHEQQMRDLALTTKLQTAEAIARSKYTDFDEKIGVFAELLQATPGLHQQWLAAADPADFAYRTAKSHKELSEAGSIEAMREQIRKEERVKMEAELKAKADALEKQRAALPPSLSDARGTKVNKPVWGGPTSLDNILKG